MSKQNTPLKIEQVFSQVGDDQKSLNRMLIYDNSIVYDVTLDAQNIATLRVMKQASNGTFYEIASKQAGQPCVNRYSSSDCHAIIYGNKHLNETKESVIAVVNNAQGAVCGGIVFAADTKSFNVLYNEDQWASFLLTPRGVRYIQEKNESEIKQLMTKNTKANVKPTCCVVIDGKEVWPIDAELAKNRYLIQRRGGRV